MKQKNNNASGVSEVVTIFLIVILVVALALVVYSLVFGSITPYMTKTTRVAAASATSSVPLDTTSSMQVIRVTPMSGELYYLMGQTNLPTNTASTAIAYFAVRDPQGQGYPVSPAILTTGANKYGTPLYIYKDQHAAYRVTDSLGSISYAPAQIRPLALGEYQVTMYDNIAHVPLTIMTVKVTGDSTSSGTVQPLSLPVLNTLPNSSWVTHGGVTNRTDSSGLTLYTFDGNSGYLSATSNPALAFTGDLSLSLWMKPTATGDATTSSNWHTIIGKGQLNGVNNENDNYQMMQLGNKLLFEWNDAGTNTHYQAITTTTPVTAGTMQYVTATVSGGTLTIKVNGITQSLSYNTGNVPFASGTSLSTPPTVSLKNNANDLLTGKQNAADSANAFYYKGDMSEVALYNRALTNDEIAHNMNYQQI